jgi:hypothetical protein
LQRIHPVVVLATCLALAGCLGRSALDELARETDPKGSAFDRTLYKDYSILARSFGKVPALPGTSFDQEGSYALSDVDNSVAGLANGFARKALDSGKGTDVAPEEAPDEAATDYHLRLLRALGRGRDQFPQLAARTQVDYDCWVMNGRVDSQRAASAACKRSLDKTLPELERGVHQQAVKPVTNDTAPVNPAIGAPQPGH